jgi:hypothetical protein
MGIERALRIAGAVLLVAIALVALWAAIATSRAVVTDNGLPPEANDVAGRVEFYDDDVIVISTSTEGLRRVRVDAQTFVREPERAADLTALLPGRQVAAWLGGPAVGGDAAARAIFVWGAPSR